MQRTLSTLLAATAVVALTATTPALAGVSSAVKSTANAKSSAKTLTESPGDQVKDRAKSKVNGKTSSAKEGAEEKVEDNTGGIGEKAGKARRNIKHKKRTYKAAKFVVG